ncbi:hypothetical protein CYMTET_37894 [Cymbomonas tetramitiformis]|uniref:Reverse transcriptase Ty1/copia-type domain-containing protein n=1 Tax=Cymbomonas tetramitiformis TaxID=36881 RepID=A0AAE0F5I6_9CHLO|nr:hypothetical protein CYMTET_37894 [Cymbomonas tetramitiformis]
MAREPAACCAHPPDRWAQSAAHADGSVAGAGGATYDDAYDEDFPAFQKAPPKMTWPAPKDKKDSLNVLSVNKFNVLSSDDAADDSDAAEHPPFFTDEHSEDFSQPEASKHARQRFISAEKKQKKAVAKVPFSTIDPAAVLDTMAKPIPAEVATNTYTTSSSTSGDLSSSSSVSSDDQSHHDEPAGFTFPIIQNPECTSPFSPKTQGFSRSEAAATPYELSVDSDTPLEPPSTPSWPHLVTDDAMDSWLRDHLALQAPRHIDMGATFAEDEFYHRYHHGHGETHVYTTSTSTPQNEELLVDSGASNCLFNSKSMFTHVNPCTSTLSTANSTDFKPAGIGTAKLDFMMDNGTVQTVVLPETYYDPNAPNLLSVRQMIDCSFASPDFIKLTWNHDARIFDILDTGKDYIVHPDQWSPSSTSAHSLAQERRPLLEPSPSVLAEKGTVDWMAFLQAPIPEDEQYNIKFPKEYVHPEGYIGAKMLYALYGHRTSGRLWSETAHKFMSDNFPTLKRSTFDECLYIGNVNGKLMMVLIYVDDFVVGCADELTKAYFHERIMSTFTATYSGVINQFLQLKIDVTTELNDKGDTVPVKIDISNERSIEHLASKFEINTSKQQPRSPMLEGLNIKLPDANAIDRSIETPLRSIVYSLLWLARTIRPDIYYHVTYLAQFCHTPTAEIMAAAKRILAYVYGTRDFSLTYQCDKTRPRLALYCDADHAGDTSDRNSVSGYCIYLHGMLVDWWSKKQNSSTALSSTEAEYIAMSEACTSALGIRNTLDEYWDFSDSSIPVHIDNEAVTHIATQRQLSSKLKHVEVRYHAVRQWCIGEHAKFHTVWISTDDNMADIFTKALPITKHGVPLITKHTAALLNIKDRNVHLQEQLRAAAKQQQHAAEQKLEKKQSNESIILATLRKHGIYPQPGSSTMPSPA